MGHSFGYFGGPGRTVLVAAAMSYGRGGQARAVLMTFLLEVVLPGRLPVCQTSKNSRAAYQQSATPVLFGSGLLGGAWDLKSAQ